jgi:Ni,Fe-hydrogenase maturation factor
MVGCQPLDAESVDQEMTPPVTRAVDVAVAEILDHVGKLTNSGVPSP